MRSMGMIFFVFFVTLGCVTYEYAGREVNRIDTDTTIDLSGKWNDADSRIVAEALSRDLVSGAWITRFAAKTAGFPVVIVGTVRNLSSEHISVISFIKDIERAMVNSGRLRVVASPTERVELRAERYDQQIEASAETRARLRAETGADFMLVGNITSQSDVVPGQKVVLYQVDLELIDIELNEKVWIGSEKIKKDISRR